MLIIKRTHGYNANRKHVYGRGFVDSLTSSLKSIGTYISQNKDLIARPMLGAVGNLAATGLQEGTKALINHIINKNAKNKVVNQKNSERIQSPQLDAKAQSILQNIIEGADIPVGNIIGSGIKRF